MADPLPYRITAEELRAEESAGIEGLERDYEARLDRIGGDTE